MRICAAISLCGLLAGCGAASTPAPASVSTLKNALVSYPIDANVGVNLYYDTYAITTNGLDWSVAWTGDDATHDFSGYVAVGGNISNVTTDGLYADDYVQQTDYNLLEFDAQTDYTGVQSFTFTSDTVPVRFYLYVDGVPAVYQVVYTSGGIESTTDDVPFDLTPTGMFAIRAIDSRPMAAARPAPAFSQPNGRVAATLKSSRLDLTTSAKRVEAPPSRRAATQTDR